MKKAIPGVLIVAMLMLPAGLLIFGDRASEIENRALVEWPSANRSDIETAEYFMQAADAIVDRLPLRQAAVRYNSEATLRILGESSNSRVVAGGDEWLFYAEATKQECFEPMEDSFVESSMRARTLMQHIGKDLYILVAPDKAAVYHELLPTESCVAESAEAISRASGLAPAVLFPYQELRLLATDSPPGDTPYYQWDSHWTTFGAAAGSRDIVSAIDPTLWDDSSLTAGTPTNHGGDLSDLLGISRQEVIVPYQSIRPGVVTEQSNLPELVSVGGTPIATAISRRYENQSDGSPLIGERALLLHDSFGVKLLPTLQPYFAHLDAVSHHRIDHASLPRILETEILILEFVQRKHTLMTGRPIDEGLAAILADEMDQVPFTLATDGTTTAVSTEGSAACIDRYLIIDRPTSTDPEVIVDGQALSALGHSLTAAYWSAAGRWTIETADTNRLASIRVVGVCPDVGS